MQLFAITLTTVAYYLLARSGDLTPGWPLTLCEEGTSCHSASLLVRWSYLLMAFGVAFTNNRIVARATEWLRNASHQTRHDQSELPAKAVMVQLAIVTVGSVVEELDTPAEVVVAIGGWVGGEWMAAILWPAMWSIVIAAVGAIVHAAFKAVPNGITED